MMVRRICIRAWNRSERPFDHPKGTVVALVWQELRQRMHGTRWHKMHGMHKMQRCDSHDLQRKRLSNQASFMPVKLVPDPASFPFGTIPCRATLVSCEHDWCAHAAGLPM